MRSQACRTLISSTRPQIIPLRLTVNTRLLSSSSRKAPQKPGLKALRAAPTIPFFGAFFSSNRNNESSEAMSYPDQRSEDQWRAVLNPGSSSTRQISAIKHHIAIETNDH